MTCTLYGLALLAFLWSSMNSIVPWYQLLFLSGCLLLMSAALARLPPLLRIVAFVYQPLSGALFAMVLLSAAYAILSILALRFVVPMPETSPFRLFTSDWLAIIDIGATRILGMFVYLLVGTDMVNTIFIKSSNPFLACLPPINQAFVVKFFPGYEFGLVTASIMAIGYVVGPVYVLRPDHALPDDGKNLAGGLTLVVMVLTATIVVTQLMIEARSMIKDWRVVAMLIVQAALMTTCLSCGFAFALCVYFEVGARAKRVASR